MDKVSDLMTRGVRTLTPEDTMLQAAQAMEALDVGSLPVCDDDRLVGMVTDRDLVLRGIAQGYTPGNTRLDGLITRQVQCCHEDDAVDEVLQQMRDAGIRRMPVLDRDERLVGILTLGDVAAKTESPQAGEALAEISQPARPDRSGQSRASGTAGGGTAEDPSQQLSS